MRLLLRTLLLLSLPLAAHAEDWRTPAEVADYRTTPRLAETMAWLERLAAADDAIRIESFGTSPEGRALPLVVASADSSFTPQRARERGHRVLLVQAGIHAGEIEGKDAGLALLRDLTVGGGDRRLLERTVLVFIPVFNVDGHERMSRWNRVNQNGPEEMGFRATAQNLNLNRDHVKADAPEMRAWLALWRRWQPDLFVDIHTTNGADYQYDLTWYLEEWDNQAAPVRRWQREALVGRVFPATDRRGHVLGPYINLVDPLDVRKGLVNFGSGPRFSTGYAALHGRPGLLVETHMLKPYAQRVKATHALLLELLRELHARGDALAQALAEADAQRPRAGTSLPLAMRPAARTETFRFKGVAFEHQRSEVSGTRWVRYDPARPQVFEVPFRRDLEVAASATLPAAWVVAPSEAEAIARLRAHGVGLLRLGRPLRVALSGWQATAPRWQPAPFEGRIGLAAFELARIERERVLPAGTVVVPVDPSTAAVAAHLLEPEAPDSLLRWGFFNARMERKEYADARKAEAIARDLLAVRPALRAEFEQRLQDPAFAADPQARLDFFFARSPWADPELSVLPVWRADADGLAALRAAASP
jgi:hypothetical protein